MKKKRITVSNINLNRECKDTRQKTKKNMNI